VSRIVAVNVGIRYSEARKRYAEVVLAGAVRAERHVQVSSSSSSSSSSCCWSC
jgi:hypothetical protein